MSQMKLCTLVWSDSMIHEAQARNTVRTMLTSAEVAQRVWRRRDAT